MTVVLQLYNTLYTSVLAQLSHTCTCTVWSADTWECRPAHLVNEPVRHGCAAGLRLICFVRSSELCQEETVSGPAEAKDIMLSSIIGNKAIATMIRCQF